MITHAQYSEPPYTNISNAKARMTHYKNMLFLFIASYVGQTLPAQQKDLIKKIKHLDFDSEIAKKITPLSPQASSSSAAMKPWYEELNKVDASKQLSSAVKELRQKLEQIEPSSPVLSPFEIEKVLFNNIDQISRNSFDNSDNRIHLRGQREEQKPVATVVVPKKDLKQCMILAQTIEAKLKEEEDLQYEALIAAHTLKQEYEARFEAQQQCIQQQSRNLAQAELNFARQQHQHAARIHRLETRNQQLFAELQAQRSQEEQMKDIPNTPTDFE